ncbi:MAG: acetyl-CoA carboxylase biotin carboxyl carrier protein [Limisphaerales bacterium]
MDLKDIKAIVDLMKKNSISEFELEREGVKLKLKRGTNGAGSPALHDDPGGGLSTPAAMAVAHADSIAHRPPPSNEQDIKSPMIGTFYRAPSPESSPYVEIGSEVGPETVVGIIEAMKVMNEIKAETRGIITQSLLDNAKPVEFGQPLFKVRPL